jgi:putative tryptophan/tyrosine transport system substrate-binding protein
MQFDQSTRRELIALLGGALAAWPLALRAQPHPARLGFLPIGSPSNSYDKSLVEAFQQGLRRVGLIDNRDIVLDVIWAKDHPDQAVTEALQRGAKLLIPCGSSASVAAKRQTSSIPIILGLQEIEWVISGIIAADKLVDRGFLQV